MRILGCLTAEMKVSSYLKTYSLYCDSLNQLYVHKIL